MLEVLRFIIGAAYITSFYVLLFIPILGGADYDPLYAYLSTIAYCVIFITIRVSNGYIKEAVRIIKHGTASGAIREFKNELAIICILVLLDQYGSVGLPWYIIIAPFIQGFGAAFILGIVTWPFQKRIEVVEKKIRYEVNKILDKYK